jgi:hypothetical protein
MEPAVPFDRVIASGRRIAGGDEQLGAVIQRREADIDVIEVHVRCGDPAGIGYNVVDRQPVLADPGLDAAAQDQIFPKDRRLHDLAFSPEGALVAIPARAVASEPCRQVRDAAMQSEALGLLGWVVVVRGGVLGHEEGVLHAAGRQQPATETAQPA